MKRMLYSFATIVAAVLVADSGFAATGRVGVYRDVTTHSSRMPSIPVTAIGVTTSVSNVKKSAEPAKVEPDTTPDEPDVKPDEPEKPDMREKEREACIRNNIGIGNTFVWASRYSDINNYSTMVEDVEHPENNTCFVLVGLRSIDPRVDLSDIPGKYFEMGRNITCGSWVDEKLIEKRILDAKKAARTWATVGGAVGGAALGVGAMELFGNKLIGGAVEGQKSLQGNELLRSQLLALKKTNATQYNEVVNKLHELREACIGNESNSKCTEFADLYDLN